MANSTSQTTLKSESEPPEKRSKLTADDSPPTSDDEEEDAKPSNVSNNKMSVENENSDSTDSESSASTEGRPQTSGTSSSAHVRSCARFPLLTQGLKQMSNQTNAFTNLLTKNSSINAKPEVKGLAALMVPKKKNQSSRDRLFKSLKGLKKSSELSSRLSTTSSLKKISKSSINSSNCVSTSTSTSTTTSSSSVLTQSHSSNSSHSSDSTAFSSKANIVKTETNVQDFNDESTDSEIEDVSHLATVDDHNCDMKNRVDTRVDTTDQPFAPTSDQQSEQSLPKRPLIQPTHVVRPAPLLEDICSDEETEEESKDSEDDSDEERPDANNNRLRRQRAKAMEKYFRKLKTARKELTQERDVMVSVMRYLTHKDLHTCMRVCKQWLNFASEPKFWRHLDLSHKKVSAGLLKGVVIRQPRHLNLSWTAISRRQLFWLICRLPQLESLSLVGCTASSVAALCTVNCPRLAYLDLSWVSGLDDQLMQDLLRAPDDSRPGLVETRTRLRFLSEIRLCGQCWFSIGSHLIVCVLS